MGEYRKLMAEIKAARAAVVDPADLAKARELGARAAADPTAPRAPAASKDWMDLVAKNGKGACKLADAFTASFDSYVREDLDRAEDEARMEWMTRADAEGC